MLVRSRPWLCPRLIAAAVAACALTATSAPPASAHGHAWPYHRIGPLDCTSVAGEMRIYPPSQMVSSFEVYGPYQFEIVWWRPDLLRYNRPQGRWKRVLIGEWHYARATTTGLLEDRGWYWFQGDANTPITWVPYTIYRAGRYRVRHLFEWDGLDGRHRQRGPWCRYV